MTLEERLLETYDDKTLPADLKEEVLSFLAQNPSVATHDIRFVKTLTKALSKIILEEPESLNGQSDRAIQYNIEGAAMAARFSQEETNLTGRRYAVTMQSHFNYHAGFIARRVAELERIPENRIPLLIKAHDYYSTAAEIILQINPREAAIVFIDAQDIAKTGQDLALRIRDYESRGYFLKKREAAIAKAIRYSENYADVHVRAHLKAALFQFSIFSVEATKSSAKKLEQSSNEFLEHYEANPEAINLDPGVLLRIKARLHIAQDYLRAKEVKNMLKSMNR